MVTCKGGAKRGPGQAELVAKPQPARAPKATIVRVKNSNLVVKPTMSYKELPEINRNHNKLPEAAVFLSGEIYPS